MWIYIGKIMEGNKGIITLKNQQYNLEEIRANLKENWSFGAFLWKQVEWPRPSLEWSRTLGVVTRDQKYKGKSGWSGRAPPRWSRTLVEWSRTLQSLKFAANCPNSPSLPLACNFLLPNAQWRPSKREIAFIWPFWKNLTWKTHFIMFPLWHSFF